MSRPSLPLSLFSSASVENLEARTLLSAPAFIEAGGRLVVRGTSGNDTITISAKPGDASKIRVDLNNKNYDFAAKSVKLVKIEAGAGNDRIISTNSSGAMNAPLFALGGAGNDTLDSATADDALLGEAGNDVVVARAGKNYVNGGAGNDKLFTGTGNDTVLGEAGNDAITDSGGTNTISAGPGVNSVVKGPLPPVITSPDTSVALPDKAPTPSVPEVPETPSSSNPFVIGVWSQPYWSFDKWQGRGINTVVGYEGLGGTVSVEKFSDEATKRGLYMIRHPNADPKKDLIYKNLLAWMQNDEPDYRNVPAATLQAEYAKLKSTDPNKPVFVNFAGSFALWGYGGKKESDYQAWMKGADWISNDLYPITAHNRPSALDAPGKAVERLADWSGGKRQFAVIEASDQQLADHTNYPGVNPDQFRAEVFNAVISGATGIIYFPQKIGGGFLFDNMTPAIETEMKKVNARLSAIGAALMSPKDPFGHGIEVDGSLRATWRYYNGKTYWVVLNNSNKSVSANMDVSPTSATSARVDGESRTVTIKNHQISDTFKPYEAHVYVV